MGLGSRMPYMRWYTSECTGWHITLRWRQAWPLISRWARAGNVLASWKECMWLGDPGDGFHNLAVILSRQSTAVCSDQTDARGLNRTACFRSLLPVKWPNMIPDALGGAIGYSCSPRHLCEWQLPPRLPLLYPVRMRKLQESQRKGAGVDGSFQGITVNTRKLPFQQIKELKYLFITHFILFTERL